MNYLNLLETQHLICSNIILNLRGGGNIEDLKTEVGNMQILLKELPNYEDFADKIESSI